MPTVNPTYNSPLGQAGWNYIRYVGPWVNPTPTEPLFLCMRLGELVVAANREPSKLWIVNRLRAEEDDVNRRACSFKHEGTQDYIGYQFPPQGNGEVAIGPQARFDVFRVSPMRRPCHIKVYQDPCAPAGESGKEDANDTELTVDDQPMEIDDTEVNDGNRIEVEEPAKPPLDWYLGVSEDLKVVLKSFLAPLEGPGSSGVTDDRPIWELVTRDEAIDEDHPSVPAPVARDPRATNNPMLTEYYTRPDRFEAYDRSFWPPRSKPYC